MNTKLISITPDAEKIIAYCARVSSDKQDNPNYAKLIEYCIKHGHWSILEQASMTIEITTSRAIAAQILRHRSFSFQEHSQRYSPVFSHEEYGARRQDDKNRQNSIDDMSEDDKIWFKNAQQDVWDLSKRYYDEAISRGVAKECARMLLPLNTTTRLYMTGTIRSWAHYLQVRTGPETQKEHRDVANSCRDIFISRLPTISKALGWS